MRISCWLKRTSPTNKWLNIYYLLCFYKGMFFYVQILDEMPCFDDPDLVRDSVVSRFIALWLIERFWSGVRFDAALDEYMF